MSKYSVRVRRPKASCRYRSSAPPFGCNPPGEYGPFHKLGHDPENSLIHLPVSGQNLSCPGGVLLWLHDCSGVIVHGGFHGSAVHGAALSTAAAAKMPASKSFVTLFSCPPMAVRLSQYTPGHRHGDATEEVVFGCRTPHLLWLGCTRRLRERNVL